MAHSLICPRCHQPVRHERFGVYLPERKAAIVDAICRAGDIGHIAAAPPELLPPPAPYPSPYELMKTQRELWRVRVALEGAAKAIQEALVAVHKAEHR